MSLSAGERTEFIKILVDNVPAQTFTEVVLQQRLVADYETLRKDAPEDPAEARRVIATRVVDKYDSVGKVWQLARGLYKRSYLDDQLGPALANFMTQPTTEE